MTTFLESYARRAEKRARHARAVCDEVKTAKAHKRDERRAKAARRDAIAELRSAEALADWRTA